MHFCVCLSVSRIAQKWMNFDEIFGGVECVIRTTADQNLVVIRITMRIQIFYRNIIYDGGIRTMMKCTTTRGFSSQLAGVCGLRVLFFQCISFVHYYVMSALNNIITYLLISLLTYVLAATYVRTEDLALRMLRYRPQNAWPDCAFVDASTLYAAD